MISANDVKCLGPLPTIVTCACGESITTPPLVGWDCVEWLEGKGWTVPWEEGAKWTCPKCTKHAELYRWGL